MIRVCETCGAELVRKKRFYSDGKPNGLEPLPLFEKRRTCGGKCVPQVWRQFELTVMAVVYPYFPAALIAKGLGKTPAAVREKGVAMGMKKTARAKSNAARYRRDRVAG